MKLKLEELLDTLPNAYIVGGAVRDFVMGNNPHDFDVSTSATPDQIAEILPGHVFDVGTGKNFGTVIFNSSDVGQVEITTMRRDVTGGRHPVVEFTDNIEEDLARRDFTFNAMAMDYDGIIIDPFNGITAIDKEKIIPVLPNETFTLLKGDPLRVLRAIRFKLRFGFDIDSHTRTRMECANLFTLSGDRIYMELEKMFEVNATSAIVLINSYNALQKILPEIHSLHSCLHNPVHHPEGNAFIHTMLALRHVKNEDMLTKMSVLLHDVGKYSTKNGTTYHGHAKAGIPIAESVMKRLGRSKPEVTAVKFVVENHMKMHALSDMRSYNRRLLYESPYFDLLLTVNEADISMKPVNAFDPREFYLNDVELKSRQIKPLLNGHELMALGYEGIDIGLITKNIIQKQLEGKILTKEDAFNYIHYKYFNHIITIKED